MAKLLLLNGPNLNMLGKREPGIYGQQDLDTIVKNLQMSAEAAGHQLQHLQSNAEHVLIDAIHTAMGEIDFILFNPGAFTHTSIAIRDALLAINTPFIELHLSNVHSREDFRRHSYFSDIAQGLICGFGANSYQLALKAALDQLQNSNN